MGDEPEVILERRDAVLVIRITRPEARNALNSAVMAGVGRGIAEADSSHARAGATAFVEKRDPVWKGR